LTGPTEEHWLFFVVVLEARVGAVVEQRVFALVLYLVFHGSAPRPKNAGRGTPFLAGKLNATNGLPQLRCAARGRTQRGHFRASFLTASGAEKLCSSARPRSSRAPCRRCSPGSVR